MTDVLEPLRQVVYDATLRFPDEPDDEVSVGVSLQEARAILDAYRWLPLDYLGEPHAGVWPWDGSLAVLWVAGRHNEPVAGRWYEPWACWLPNSDPDPGPDDERYGIGRHLVTHIRPLDPPPGGGDG